MSAMAGLWMLGGTQGGISAILLVESSGIFAPLWLAAAFMFLATLAMVWYLIKPGGIQAFEMELEILDGDTDDQEEDAIQAPKEIDQCALWNIVGKVGSV